jgi:inner membrane protein involved in colicin E2 resistance
MRNFNLIRRSVLCITLALLGALVLETLMYSGTIPYQTFNLAGWSLQILYLLAAFMIGLSIAVDE